MIFEISNSLISRVREKKGFISHNDVIRDIDFYNNIIPKVSRFLDNKLALYLARFCCNEFIQEFRTIRRSAFIEEMLSNA